MKCPASLRLHRDFAIAMGEAGAENQGEELCRMGKQDDMSRWTEPAEKHENAGEEATAGGRES